MRINKFVAAATGMSRRKADDAISNGRVKIGGRLAVMGDNVNPDDVVTLDSSVLVLPNTQTIILNKPEGYVVSRDGQGSKTIYDLLPSAFSQLKPVGRLDKDSSGLLVMTNDGDLANNLTHPSKQKLKVYQIRLDKPLQPLHRQMISDIGVVLDDGPSKFEVERQKDGDDQAWIVRMHEGRNRQIRRTFTALGYTVTKLHRTEFGNYTLAGTNMGDFKQV
jgi:23S rRNA pseudouridine2605 synthase